MKQYNIITFFCFIFWSCNSINEKKNEKVVNLNSTRQIIGKKFFEYDSIDYYVINIDESKIGDIYNNQSKSEIDSFKMGIILGDIPKNISDSTFIDKLSLVGYKKLSLNRSKFDSIDKIFAEKNTTENFATTYIYIYRDILIFKKEGKIIGTSKLCFGCMAYQINGTTAKTENFGQEGDFERLKTLLRQ